MTDARLTGVLVHWSGEIATKRRNWNSTGATRKRRMSWTRNAQYFATKTPINSSIQALPGSRKCTFYKNYFSSRIC